MPSPPRRRPPSRPPAPGDPPPPATPAALGPFRMIATVGTALIVVVVAIAFATGTAGDLPWGALIGVAVLLVAMLVTSRRRERRMREAFPDED